jgi:alpha-tubulin suppressor-like RCC1 family protein
MNVTNLCSVSCGDHHSAAITRYIAIIYRIRRLIIRLQPNSRYISLLYSSGECFVWGHSGSGRLGFSQQVGGVFNHVLLPSPLEGLRSRGTRVIQVACGGYHTLFLTLTREVYSAGANDSGQLGIDSRTEILGLTKVMLDEPACFIAAGDRSSAVICDSRFFIDNLFSHLYMYP